MLKLVKYNEWLLLLLLRVFFNPWCFPSSAEECLPSKPPLHLPVQLMERKQWPRTWPQGKRKRAVTNMRPPICLCTPQCTTNLTLRSYRRLSVPFNKMLTGTAFCHLSKEWWALKVWQLLPTMSTSSLLVGVWRKVKIHGFSVIPGQVTKKKTWDIQLLLF